MTVLIYVYVEKLGMKHLTFAFLSLGLMAMVIGCEKKAAEPSKAGDSTRKALSSGEPEGHDHDDAAGHGAAGEEHDHGADSDHETAAEEDDHGHAGEKHALGSKPVADYAVEVVQVGELAPGATELVFEVAVRGETAPAAVRVVVRAPDGGESLKVKANKTGSETYDAHVGELPKALPAGSQVVVEVAGPDGAKATASFELHL